MKAGGGKASSRVSGKSSTAKKKGPSKPAAPQKSATASPVKAPAKAASVPAKSLKKAPAPVKAAAAGKPASGKPTAVENRQPGPAPAKPTPESASKPAPAPAAGADSKKPLRKGITIVTPKPPKAPKPKSVAATLMALGGRLIAPGAPVRKPLIPSGPNARVAGSGLGGKDDGTTKKSPFGKRELSAFRATLVKKRAELVGDISTMEHEALRGQSGSLSHLPQHIADQGSDAYDQSLSLDLAAADRKLIKEIDDALLRIEKGTFGLCEMTGKAVSADRLAELPWTRYSIEAARELERRSLRP